MRGLTTIILLSVTSLAWADLIVYPAEGQTTEQQQQDEAECLVWAKNRTGFDPLATPQTAQAQAEQKRGGAVRGAAGGAAVGAIVGDSDDAKKGAAAGAVLGRMRQNRENRRARQETAAEGEAIAKAEAGERAQFDRAYTACLEGRGYSVK